MPLLKNDRLLVLDVARGIAALCVVVYHWLLFFYVTEDGAPAQNYPLYNFLAPIYKNGWLGADFFFVLSGAIFFMKYANTVANEDITLRRFFILRFSRLGPLYYATLFLTTFLQGILLLLFGRFILYDQIDAPHFVANLLLIQNWGIIPFLSELSFNAPAWSLSIEALLYVFFFALFRFASPNHFYFMAIALIGLGLIHSDLNAPLGRGIWCFFIGGAAAWFYTRPQRVNRSKPEIYGIAVLLLLLIAFGSHLGFEMSSDYTKLNTTLPGYILRTAFFSSLVCCLVFSDGILQRVSTPLSFLGDMSYSSYLLHYPLQLAFIICVTVFNGTFVIDPFHSPWTMLVFFVALVAISLLSFRLLETPVKKAIRSALLDENKASGPELSARS